MHPVRYRMDTGMKNMHKDKPESLKFFMRFVSFPFIRSSSHPLGSSIWGETDQKHSWAWHDWA